MEKLCARIFKDTERQAIYLFLFVYDKFALSFYKTCVPQAIGSDRVE